MTKENTVYKIQTIDGVNHVLDSNEVDKRCERLKFDKPYNRQIIKLDNIEIHSFSIGVKWDLRYLNM